MLEPKGCLFSFLSGVGLVPRTHFGDLCFTNLYPCFNKKKKKSIWWKLSHSSDFPLQASVNAYIKTNLGDPAKVLLSQMVGVRPRRYHSHLPATPLNEESNRVTRIYLLHLAAAQDSSAALGMRSLLLWAAS